MAINSTGARRFAELKNSEENLMDTHPIILVQPFFDWLNEIIRDHGLTLYLVAVWTAPFLILWILKGGSRKCPARGMRDVKLRRVAMDRVETTRPPQFVISAKEASKDDRQSFSA